MLLKITVLGLAKIDYWLLLGEPLCHSRQFC